MTRQRLHQIARNQQGLCCYCTSPLTPGSASMCYYHLVKKRATQRKKLGLRAGHKSGMGRPAITRTPLPTEFTITAENEKAA